MRKFRKTDPIHGLMMIANIGEYLANELTQITFDKINGRPVGKTVGDLQRLFETLEAYKRNTPRIVEEFKRQGFNKKDIQRAKSAIKGLEGVEIDKLGDAINSLDEVTRSEEFLERELQQQ
jgi:hypothetical protein